MGSATRINEIIDNERLQRSQSMTMPMNQYGVREVKLDERQVDGRADCLVRMFNAPGSKPLYCDAVRYLTMAYLDEQAKIAMEKGDSPAKLFGYLIYKKLRSLGLYAKN